MKGKAIEDAVRGMERARRVLEPKLRRHAKLVNELARLEPAVEEARLLDASLKAIRESVRASGGTPVRRTRRKRSPRAKAAKATAQRPARSAAVKKKPASRRKATPGRSAQFLAAVKANPGLKASELAKKLGLSANHVHGLGRKARDAKQVRKDAKGRYFPTKG